MNNNEWAINLQVSISSAVDCPRFSHCLRSIQRSQTFRKAQYNIFSNIISEKIYHAVFIILNIENIFYKVNCYFKTTLTPLWYNAQRIADRKWIILLKLWIHTKCLLCLWLCTDRNFVVEFDTWAKYFLDLTFCRHSNASCEYSGQTNWLIFVCAIGQLW